MTYQRKSNSVVADIDVRMMSSGFRQYGDTVHKLHCSNEICEFPVANELSIFQFPQGKAGHDLLQLLLA